MVTSPNDIEKALAERGDNDERNSQQAEDSRYPKVDTRSLRRCHPRELRWSRISVQSVRHFVPERGAKYGIVGDWVGARS